MREYNERGLTAQFHSLARIGHRPGANTTVPQPLEGVATEGMFRHPKSAVAYTYSVRKNKISGAKSAFCYGFHCLLTCADVTGATLFWGGSR